MWKVCQTRYTPLAWLQFLNRVSSFKIKNGGWQALAWHNALWWEITAEADSKIWVTSQDGTVLTFFFPSSTVHSKHSRVPNNQSQTQSLCQDSHADSSSCEYALHLLLLLLLQVFAIALKFILRCPRRCACLTGGKSSMPTDFSALCTHWKHFEPLLYLKPSFAAMHEDAVIFRSFPPHGDNYVYPFFQAHALRKKADVHVNQCLGSHWWKTRLLQSSEQAPVAEAR